MKSFMTVEGLYNYDSSLFDSFKVPDGLDKQTAVDVICIRTRELELLYPDFNYIKNRISIWSKKFQSNWEALYKTTVLEYNPIENYDRQEDWTDTDTGSETSQRDGKNEGKSSTSNESMRSDKVTDQNTAFNSGLQDYHKQLVDSDGTNSENHTESSSDSESGSVNRKNTHTRSGRAHGNIGVTTTQEMIQSERDLVVFNMYDVIAESFVETFCLMIY